MGLDWNPENKPKPGHEQEFAHLIKIRNERPSAEREEVEDRFEEISITPYESLGAPMVGRAREADKWLYGKWAGGDRKRDWDDFYDAIKGYWVYQLIPPCDGKSRYSSGPFPRSHADELSFCGEFMKECEAIMSVETYSAAWSHKSADELLAYGKAILAEAEAYAARCEIDLEAMAKLSLEEMDEDEYMLDIHGGGQQMGDILCRKRARHVCLVVVLFR